MQQENTYIRCIKCWVKSFNLAPYIFVFYIYKLQYDRRYIILNNKLNIPIPHTLLFIHGLEPTVFLICNVRLQSYLYRTIDKPLCFVILIGFTTSINKKVLSGVNTYFRNWFPRDILWLVVFIRYKRAISLEWWYHFKST